MPTTYATPYTSTDLSSYLRPYRPEARMPREYGGGGTTGADPNSTDIYAPMRNQIEGRGDIAVGANIPGGVGTYGANPYSNGKNGGYARPGGGGDYPGNKKKAARQMGLDTLLGILASQGHTDPLYLNRQLTDISRGTEAGQNQLDEYLASQGLSGSGVGAATHAAIGEAGADRRSGAIANENRIAEERKRQDLQLIVDQILGPRLTRRGQDMALKAAKYANRGGSNLGAFGSLLGGLGNILGASGLGKNNNTTTDNSYPYGNDYGSDPNQTYDENGYPIA